MDGFEKCRQLGEVEDQKSGLCQEWIGWEEMGRMGKERNYRGSTWGSHGLKLLSARQVRSVEPS